MVDQRKKSCIKINIRELNKVLSTMYLPIYTNYWWSMLGYF